MGKATGSSETDYKKVLSRNDELIKQETTLKKEYTTLLRKISSLCAVLDQLEGETPLDEPRLISERSFKRAPALQWHNEQIELLKNLSRENQEIAIPTELVDSYKLYKDTPLLHRDVQ